MTDLTLQRPLDIPAGRPVRRFVVAQVVLAVLFGALWWSGAVAPRMGVGSRVETGSFDTASGRGTATHSLRNDAPTALQIHDATLGDGRMTVTSVHVDGRDLATGSEWLAGGRTATLAIEYTCRPTQGADRLPVVPTAWKPTRIEISVTTPIGLERTRAAGTVDLPLSCVG